MATPATTATPLDHRRLVRDRTAQIYGIDNWGFGYFGINERGHLAVSPHRAPDLSIDVFEVVRAQVEAGETPPFLLRFPQILDERLEALHGAFGQAIREYHYGGSHIGAFPIKVNQKKSVVRRLVSSGVRFGYGLEVGSKAELLAALAMPLANDALVICNGIKDDLYLGLAMQAESLGRNAVIVVEDLEDLRAALDLAATLDVRSSLGIRVKLSARGGGRWEETSGEFAKFGMSTASLMEALSTVRKAGAEDQLEMLHFHIGSQINDIHRAKHAFKEAARVYACAREMGFGIEYLNVGGGLAVDYDGSRTASEFSMNYSVQEFANDIVYAVGEVCANAGTEPPTIVTEHGRATAAYHAMVVADVRRVVEPGVVNGDTIGAIQSEAAPVLELEDLAEGITEDNCRERFHDAGQQRGDMTSLFELGYLDLQDKAKGEWLYWRICREVAHRSRHMRPRPKELQDLDQMLASKYVCNFSTFQSLPDLWAFEQLFPVMPIHRLDEAPTERGVLCDITCDSDGTVDRFVDPKRTRRFLELHTVRSDELYYLGFLLLGAYQETLGDMHNLLGVVQELHVEVRANGSVHVRGPEHGDRVRDVLGATGHEPEVIRASLSEILAGRRATGATSEEAGRAVLATASRILDDYTYLV